MVENEKLNLAAENMFDVHRTVLAMRDFPDVHLRTDRLFSATAGFGENVLGDAAAIFGEAVLPLIELAEAGSQVDVDVSGQTAIVLKVLEKAPKIKSLAVDGLGNVLFQINFERVQDGMFKIYLLDPPHIGPEYRFQNTFFSANVRKNEKWALHPIGRGQLDYCDFHKAINAFSLLRPVILEHASKREADPREFNMRSMNLTNYEELLEIDGGVFGPACAWAATRQLEECVHAAVSEMSKRFVDVHDQLRDLGVEWGKSYFVYGHEDHFTTIVKSDDLGKTALFDLWIDWCFARQGLLGVVTRDTNGDPLEVTFNQLSRGHGEFSKIEQALQLGSFEGMPAASYSFVTDTVNVSYEFFAGGGFEILETVCRQTHSTLNEPEGSERAGTIREDFSRIYRLDLDEHHDFVGGPDI